MTCRIRLSRELFLREPSSTSSKLFSRWFLTGIVQYLILNVTVFILYSISYLFVSSYGDPLILKEVILKSPWGGLMSFHRFFITLLPFLGIHAMFFYFSNAFSSLRLIKFIIFVCIFNICYLFIFMFFVFSVLFYMLIKNIDFIHTVLFILKNFNIVSYEISFLWIGLFLYATYIELKRLPL